MSVIDFTKNNCCDITFKFPFHGDLYFHKHVLIEVKFNFKNLPGADTEIEDITTVDIVDEYEIFNLLLIIIYGKYKNKQAYDIAFDITKIRTLYDLSKKYGVDIDVFLFDKICKSEFKIETYLFVKATKIATMRLLVVNYINLSADKLDDIDVSVLGVDFWKAFFNSNVSLEKCWTHFYLQLHKEDIVDIGKKMMLKFKPGDTYNDVDFIRIMLAELTPTDDKFYKKIFFISTYLNAMKISNQPANPVMIQQQEAKILTPENIRKIADQNNSDNSWIRQTLQANGDDSNRLNLLIQQFQERTKNDDMHSMRNKDQNKNQNKNEEPSHKKYKTT